MLAKVWSSTLCLLVRWCAVCLVSIASLSATSELVTIFEKWKKDVERNVYS